MENNKYYTPTIEEFYVGFEYELLGNSGRWYKNNFGDANGEYWNELSECYWDIEHNKLRVKYLDQSDIESLGWIDGETRGMTPFIFNELDPDNEFQLYYQFDNQFAQIYNCHSEFVFQGTIKNKCELIKLMQQLNIK